jgi:protein-tyrosine phosphatase
MYRFARASEHEQMIFGAARPGYSHHKINQWLKFIQAQEIERVCCLLTHYQLSRYAGLLDIYRQTFGVHRVCWAPIEDFQLADRTTLQTILQFLAEADRRGEKVVVHCSGGVGRTGQVLAAWLVYQRGYSAQDAIAAVKRMGRNPYEAVIASIFKGQNPWTVAASLNELLNSCCHYSPVIESPSTQI